MHGSHVERDGEDRIGGEPKSAFEPDPLPPVPPLRWDSLLQTAPEAAIIAVDRPDAVGTPLPDPSLFTYG